MSGLHTLLAARCALGIQAEWPAALVVDRQSIHVRCRTCSAGQFVTQLPTGGADHYVILPGGLHLEIEYKTAKDSVRRAGQREWREQCLRAGIPYRVVHVNTQEEVAAAVVDTVAWVKGVINGGRDTGGGHQNGEAQAAIQAQKGPRR